MAEDAPKPNSDDFLRMTAQMVAAYLRKNSVPTTQITEVINSVYGSLRAIAGRADQEIGDAGIHHLPRRWTQVQDAQAALAHRIQHDAGAVPPEMGPGGRLSDGRAELREATFGLRQRNRPRQGRRQEGEIIRA